MDNQDDTCITVHFKSTDTNREDSSSSRLTSICRTSSRVPNKRHSNTTNGEKLQIQSNGIEETLQYIRADGDMEIDNYRDEEKRKPTA